MKEKTKSHKKNISESLKRYYSTHPHPASRRRSVQTRERIRKSKINAVRSDMRLLEDIRLGIPYREWEPIRISVIERYGHTCMIDGETEQLDIHHCDTDPRNNNLWNLASLCKKCHRKVHSMMESANTEAKQDELVELLVKHNLVGFPEICLTFI